MLTIFVLEDDLIQQSRIENAINKALVKNKWKVRAINISGKPEQLLEAAKERGCHQLFFLDIQIDKDDKMGFKMAQQIRSNDPQAVIVFVTTHSEFLPLTFQYKVAALDFIDKLADEEEYVERIESAIEVALSHMGNSVAEDSFTFETSQAVIQVPFHKILYFETSETIHKVILHTKNEQIEFYGRLSQIEKVDERLYKCHKSFVVNPENITKIDKESGIVYFENGERCFVSKLKRKKLIEKMREMR